MYNQFVAIENAAQKDIYSPDGLTIYFLYWSNGGKKPSGFHQPFLSSRIMAENS